MMAETIDQVDAWGRGAGGVADYCRGRSRHAGQASIQR